MKVYAMILGAALAISGVAVAQSGDTIKVHFDRPVVAAGVELPAGDYAIRALATGGGSTVLTIRSESEVRANLLVNPIRAKGSSSGKSESVVLMRRGDQLWLDQVWMAPDTGYEVLQPSAE